MIFSYHSLKGCLFSCVPQSGKRSDLVVRQTSQSLHRMRQTRSSSIISKSHLLTTLSPHLINSGEKVLLQISVPFPKEKRNLESESFRHSLVQGRVALSLPVLSLISFFLLMPDSDPFLCLALPTSFLPYPWHKATLTEGRGCIKSDLDSCDCLCTHN